MNERLPHRSCPSGIARCAPDGHAIGPAELSNLARVSMGIPQRCRICPAPDRPLRGTAKLTCVNGESPLYEAHEQW
jgi:hypothetical protein